MEFEIKNDYLKAIIDSHGAELIKLYDKNGVNRMHDTINDSWKRVSPILFPQISRTRNLSYKVKGVTYHMPSHGFLRDCELEVSEKGNDFIEFKLVWNAKTYELYPYHFEIHVRYTLNLNKLKVSFNVINLDEKDMLFMLGGHPGFKLFIDNNISYNDYYLKFEKSETVDAMQVIDGFIADKYKRMLTNQNILKISRELFNPDAIILKNLKSEYVDLLCEKSDFDIRMYCKDFEILAFWSTLNNNDNFVCFEPWNGIQKNFVEDHEKMGVLSLKGKNTYQCAYIVEIIK